MEDIIKSFYIDWKLMLAQLINFTIVAWVLWRYALKPLTAIMSNRAQEIAKGLQDAKKAEEALLQISQAKDQALKEAKKQAEEIRQEAERQAQTQRQETLIRVKAEVERVLVETRQRFMVEKDQMFEEVKKQAASLVVQATSKIMGKISTPKLDHDMIEQIVKETVNKSKFKQS